VTFPLEKIEKSNPKYFFNYNPCGKTGFSSGKSWDVNAFSREKKYF
jgi:hypothetical protein